MGVWVRHISIESLAHLWIEQGVLDILPLKLFAGGRVLIVGLQSGHSIFALSRRQELSLVRIVVAEPEAGEGARHTDETKNDEDPLRARDAFEVLVVDFTYQIQAATRPTHSPAAVALDASHLSDGDAEQTTESATCTGGCRKQDSAMSAGQDVFWGARKYKPEKKTAALRPNSERLYQQERKKLMPGNRAASVKPRKKRVALWGDRNGEHSFFGDIDALFAGALRCLTRVPLGSG